MRLRRSEIHCQTRVPIDRGPVQEQDCALAEHYLETLNLEVEKEMNAALLLKIIRDANGISWRVLCEKLGFKIDSMDSISYYILQEVESLIDAGLVYSNMDELIKRMPEEKSAVASTLRRMRISHYAMTSSGDELLLYVTDTLRKIQTALGISITELANLSDNYSIRVSPLFGRHDTRYKRDVFVLCLFCKRCALYMMTILR